MLQELNRIQELCSQLSAEDLQTHLILTIKRAQEYLNKLQDAEGKTKSDDKRFNFNGESLTYTTIAEYILFIEACKSVLVELVIWGKEHIDFTDTVYDMCATYELDLSPYEKAHGR